MVKSFIKCSFNHHKHISSFNNILAMQEHRQFQALPFAVINNDLHVVKTMANNLQQEFSQGIQTNSTSSIASINKAIHLGLQSFQNLVQNLQTKISFFDCESSSVNVQLKNLDSLIYISPDCVSNLNMQKMQKKRAERCSTRGPYRSYTFEEKNHVVQLHLLGMTFASISKELQIPQKNIVRWCKEGIQGKQNGKKTVDFLMEQELSEWIKQQMNIQKIRHFEIQQKAKSLTNNSNFKASRGWLKNFMKRWFLEAKIEE